MDTPKAFPRIAHLNESERHDLLAAKRRRQVLDVLGDHGSTISLDRLAAALVERSDEGPPDETTLYDRLCIALHHKHLPKLDAHDVLTYDHSQRLVRP